MKTGTVSELFNRQGFLSVSSFDISKVARIIVDNNLKIKFVKDGSLFLKLECENRDDEDDNHDLLLAEEVMKTLKMKLRKAKISGLTDARRTKKFD